MYGVRIIISGVGDASLTVGNIFFYKNVSIGVLSVSLVEGKCHPWCEKYYFYCGKCQFKRGKCQSCVCKMLYQVGKYHIL